MKKSLVITTLLLISLAANALAEGQGAVKARFNPDVGWVILNTTASGKFIASVHLDNGLPNEELSVSIRVRYSNQTTEIFPDITTLSTNGQGKGNVQVQVDLNPPPRARLLRRVAIVWDIPLK